jgi:hypothetical protein
MPSAITPVTLAAGSVSVLVNVPPGPCSVVISAGAGTVGLYFGLGTAVTSSNGLYVPGGYPPWLYQRYVGQAGRIIYATAQSGTITATAGVLEP